MALLGTYLQDRDEDWHQSHSVGPISSLNVVFEKTDEILSDVYYFINSINIISYSRSDHIGVPFEDTGMDTLPLDIYPTILFRGCHGLTIVEAQIIASKDAEQRMMCEASGWESDYLESIVMRCLITKDQNFGVLWEYVYDQAKILLKKEMDDRWEKFHPPRPSYEFLIEDV